MTHDTGTDADNVHVHAHGHEQAVGNGKETLGGGDGSVAASELLRSYAYCSAEHPNGGITVVMVNLDTVNIAETTVALPGAWEEYTLAPQWGGDPAAAAATKTTSHNMLLNGVLLAMGDTFELPPFTPTNHASSGGPLQRLALEPLTVMLAVFPNAGATACS